MARSKKAGTMLLSKYRRKRERRTDYRRRLKLLKSGLPRLVVRASNKLIRAQLVQYNQEGDKTLVEFCSKELPKMGWKGDEDNLAAAFLTGLALARKAKEAGLSFESIIPDLGMHAPHKGGKYFALLMGAKEGGLPVVTGEGVEVEEDRLRMVALSEYAKELKQKDPSAYSRTFSRYIKRGLEPTDLPSHFDEIREKLGA